MPSFNCDKMHDPHGLNSRTIFAPAKTPFQPVHLALHD